MALVQLTEPQEPTAQQRRFAVGIDLGTTNSLVATAAAVDNDRPEVLPTAAGARMLPSAVYYQQDGACIVGAAALAKRQQEPHQVITSVKRLMGRSAEDIGSDYHYHYRAEEGMVKIITAAGDKSPVQVSADILSTLRAQALAASGEAEVAGAVITVPAYFDDAQRQATKDAARLAGLPVLRLLNEPTAAAVAYGLDNAADGLYIVYDLGGGTFDVSLLRLSASVFEVLATGGDTALGGDDYDRIIAQNVAQKVLKSLPATTLSDADWLRLTAAARVAKEALTTAATATVVAELEAGVCECEISREEFNAWTQALTVRTIACCRQVLADAEVSATEVNGVVLVGGATRMVSVRAAVADYFAQQLYDHINPDEVVALGAAAQADVLIGNHRGESWLLLDITPLSLGLETMGGLVEKVIYRNTTIPTEKHQEFTTHRDGQTAMRIHVVQGERERVADCRSLATFTLSDIPPLAAGLARIRVGFQVDADGLLSVTATEKTTGVSAGIQVKPSYGLSEEEFANMLQAAYTHAHDDLQARRLQEAVNESEELLQILDKALADADSAHLLSAAERARIAAGLARLREALTQAQLAEINAAKEHLQQVSAEFAGRRMNADIQRAIAGKKIDDIGQ